MEDSLSLILLNLQLANKDILFMHSCLYNACLSIFKKINK